MSPALGHLESSHHLVWAPLKEDSETRIQMHAICLRIVVVPGNTMGRIGWDEQGKDRRKPRKGSLLCQSLLHATVLSPSGKLRTLTSPH